MCCTSRETVSVTWLSAHSLSIVTNFRKLCTHIPFWFCLCYKGSVIRDCGDGSENVQISSGQGGDSKGIIKSSQGSYSVKSSDPTADLPIHIMPSKEDQSSTLSRKQTGLLAPLIACRSNSFSLTHLEDCRPHKEFSFPGSAGTQNCLHGTLCSGH